MGLTSTKKVVIFDLKMSTELEMRSSGGRAFQSFGAARENALSPSKLLNERLGCLSWMLFSVLLELSFFDQRNDVDSRFWHLEVIFVKLSMITTYKLQYQKEKLQRQRLKIVLICYVYI